MQSVFQCADGLLQSGLTVQLRERGSTEFELDVQQIEGIGGAGAELRFDRLLLLPFGVEQ